LPPPVASFRPANGPRAPGSRNGLASPSQPDAAIVLAPGAFKGTLSATEVTDALLAGFEHVGVRADPCPLADGGDGTLDVLLGALGGERVAVGAHDALGRPIQAEIAVSADGETAIVETAVAIGLGRLAESERDPEATSSLGAGELIAAAAERASSVLVGIGGSATNDGGAGALEAIADAGGLGVARLTCLCDVWTPWERASATYGPQKGADAAAVERLAARLDSFAARLPRDPGGVAMTGAAGGLAGGLWAGLGAELMPGASYICNLVGFDGRARRAGAVVTGEGRLDETTLQGKIVAEVAGRCGRMSVPPHAVVGSDASTEALRAELGLASVTEAGDAAAIHAAAIAIARRHSAD
jgi:glycerate kinase